MTREEVVEIWEAKKQYDANLGRIREHSRKGEKMKADDLRRANVMLRKNILNKYGLRIDL